MGFLKMWSSDYAYHVDERRIIKLPFQVSASLADTECQFYAVNARLPYGLEQKDGTLVLAPSQDGGVAIKAWQFKDQEWQKCSLGGGIHADGFSELIQIKSLEREYFSVWSPHTIQAWCNPGTIKLYYRNGLDSCVHIDTQENVSFHEFMKRNFDNRSTA